MTPMILVAIVSPISQGLLFVYVLNKTSVELIKILFFFKDIYLFMRDRDREAETQAEGEAGSMQEPDAGLTPRTSGSLREPKADAQPLNDPGTSRLSKFLTKLSDSFYWFESNNPPVARELQSTSSVDPNFIHSPQISGPVTLPVLCLDLAVPLLEACHVFPPFPLVVLWSFVKHWLIV